MSDQSLPVMRNLAASDLPVLEAWLRDAESKRRFGGMLPIPQWYDRVSRDSEKSLWLAVMEDEPVGLVDVDMASDGLAYIGLLVRPDARNNGMGRRILREAMRMLAGKGATSINAEISPDNLASRNCFRAAGFREVSDGDWIKVTRPVDA